MARRPAAAYVHPILTTYPSVWLVLVLPFASALLIARARPLRELSGAYHPATFSVGVLGLFTFLAGLVGLLPSAWTLAAVILGGAVSGFACFWPGRPDDGGEDWRRWSFAPDDEPPPGRPDEPIDWPIDWPEFDRQRSVWEGRPRVGR